MTGNTVTNVCNPKADHGVTNKLYVDQITSDAVSKNGGTMMGNLNMNGYRIKGLPTPDVPESNSDAASWLQIVNLIRKSTVENRTTVSKAGDVMTGDLTVSIDNDERRLLGCQDLTPGKSFSFLLGDAMNRLWYVLREPITMETTHGFLIKVKGEDICKIGTGLNPQTIRFFTDIRMNLNRISNLREAVDSDEVATKSYCDNRARKIYNGYIP